jgi:hypothetical protein
MFATFIRPVLLRMALAAALGIGQNILPPPMTSLASATLEHAVLHPIAVADSNPSQAPVGMGWG